MTSTPPVVVVLDRPNPEIPIEAPMVGPDVEVIELHGPGDPRWEVALRTASAVVVDLAAVDAAVIAMLDRCKLIAEYGVGVDNIDVGAAATRGIAVTTVPWYCVDELADHAVALLLNAARGISAYATATKQGAWDYRTAAPLRRARASRVGIVGFGKVGRAVASRLTAFGYDIVVHDPVVDTATAAVRMVDLDELLRTSDFVTLHCPLTSATRHLISGDQLAAMKSTAILINTARGALVDQAALVDALKTGQIAGAALDVLEIEPPRPGEAVLDAPGVVVTPHAGFYSEQSIVELHESVFAEVRRSLNREPLLHPVLPATSTIDRSSV